MSNISGEKIRERPIIKLLDKVSELSFKNNFPISEEIYNLNHISEYVGNKILSDSTGIKKNND